MKHDQLPSATAEQYVKELERAAASLPANRRAELVADVRSHIAVAVADARAGDVSGSQDEAAVAQILNRLGDPEEIVAAALGDMPPVAEDRTGSGMLEIAAVVLLLIGGFIFAIGWVLGVVLLWSSRRWTVGDKLLGTLVLPGGYAIIIPLVFLADGTEGPMVPAQESMPAWLGMTLLAIVLVAPTVTAIRLTLRARRRAAQA